ncbi:MAG: NAD(P)/FAD-dependent oxidoreductase [Fimbriimonadaceae bacterium]
MRVAVVGAGMAGLGAARTLREAGIATVVFEKSRGFGGRVATRRIADYTFDHGATIVSPRGTELEGVILNELSTDQLVEIVKPIYLSTDDRVTPVDPEAGKIKRFGYQNGVNTLGKLLAVDLDVRLESKVEAIKKDGPHYTILGESFSHVILTAPIPQTEVLLASAGDKRSFAGSQYRKCISIMFGVDEEIDRPYHALLDPNQSQPLTWLSLEHVKIPGGFRAPEGKSALVVQMSARYSRYSFEREDATIIGDTWVDIKRLLKLKVALPEVSGVMRWNYSHASNTVSYETANQLGAKILVAGDGISGARTHQAYAIGIRAANQILAGEE